MRNTIILTVVCSLALACEEGAKPGATDEAAKKPEPAAAAVTAAALKASPEPAAAPVADQGAKAAEKEAQKEIDENPLTPCCRALSRVGFTQRSPEYTAAAKECGDGMTDKKTLEQISGAIKKQLKGKSVPDECVAK